MAATTTQILTWPGRLTRAWPRWLVAVTVLLLAAGVAAGGVMVRQYRAERAAVVSDRPVPQSVDLERLTGVRFSQVAVVADGGLITLSYVVLDGEKATVFQSNTAHPPTLTSESRKLSTSKVALMKQGHSLRAGQTYYLVYDNSADAIRPGEFVTITDGAVVLAHVPVL